jgi:amicyanin
VTSTATTTTVVVPAQAAVAIQNFAFNPASVTVKAGTTVTWTNADSASHTVTSDSGSLMKSALLATGQSYSVTFTTPGTFTYHCSVHPMMHGTVVVTN